MKRRPISLILVLTGSVFSGSLAYSHDSNQQPTATTAAALQTAVETARAAAERGDVDESLQTIAAPLRNGPPVRSRLGAFVEGLFGTRDRRDGEPLKRVAARGLIELSEAWRAHEFPAEKVYRTLKSVVLPGTDAEVHRYSINGSTEPETPSAAREMIRWAVAAAQIDDLREELQRRSEKGSPLAPGMRLELALASDDPQQVRQALAFLTKQLEADPEVQSLLPLLPFLSAAVRDEESRFDSLPVVERAIEILTPFGTQGGFRPTLDNMLVAAARVGYEQAEFEKAEQHLETLLDISRLVRARSGSSDRDWDWSRQLNKLAAEFLRIGRTDRALELLGEMVDLNVPMREESDDGRTAAAGALNRVLRELNGSERYQLLYAWTMPTDSRRSVRVLSTVTSAEAPPAVFARAVGKRPNAASFPIASVGGIEGLFSTGYLLVHAARETGRLGGLIDELTELADESVPGAQHLLWLARIAEGNVAELVEQLTEYAGQLRELDLPNEFRDIPIRIRDLVLAAACLEQEPLAARGEELLAVLETVIDSHFSVRIDAIVRRAHAQAILRRFPEATSDLLDDPNLKLWIPASDVKSRQIAEGAVRETWLAHEESILHLGGPHNGYLCFRYPLQGDFEFRCRAQDGGKTQGHLAFGGLAYETYGAGDFAKIWNVDINRSVQLPFYMVRKERWPTYQRLAIASSADGVTVSVNGFPIFTDPRPETTSPWLALRCFGDRVPVFRDFEFRGDPEIPREVSLSAGDRLRGWFHSFYPASVPGEVPLAAESATGAARSNRNFHWSIRDGVIHGSREGSNFAFARPSRLSYFRPLQNDESISYEFRYEPGGYLVHPALGRLAFLIEPRGVRVRWLTALDAEWSGLAVDHAVVEPLNRRGPRPLPLEAGAWNRATLSLSGDAVVLSLNGVEVYQRKLEPGHSRTFGFYHDRSRSAVRVRSVVMRGDWPEQLENRASLTVAEDAATRETNRRATGALFQERHVPDLPLEIHRRAVEMPPEQRYEFLSRWVLPVPDHESLRLGIGFTQTHPAPLFEIDDPLDRRRIEIARESGRRRVQVGGNLVAPALDLIAVAEQLGQLDEVRDRVAAFVPQDDRARRERLALLSILQTKLGESQAAMDSLFDLFTLVQAGQHTAFEERWPETLAAYTGLLTPATRELALELSYNLFLSQARAGPNGGSEAWRRHFVAVTGLGQHLVQNPIGDRESFRSPPDLAQWAPVTRVTAWSRGHGYPPSQWQRSSDSVDVAAWHDIEYLYFQSPLRGNFQIECDVPAFGYRDTDVFAGGLWAALIYTWEHAEVGDFRRTIRRFPLKPKLTNSGDPLHYRTVVRDRTCRTYVNGRLIHEEPLSEEFVPWVALRCDKNTGGVEHVRITGEPEIPDEILLSAQPDLRDWYPYYDHETMGTPDAFWRQSGVPPSSNGILGKHRPEAAGRFRESALFYSRPMLEDGTIEYEFYYQEGAAHCHPVLDRRVILLDPKRGAGVHWLTDLFADRTGLARDNFFADPLEVRGPRQLPLVEGAWNRVALTLRGSNLHVSLNGAPVYECELEPTNQRIFGLFYYADQTEARVRNVVWRGDWPKTLPPVAEQELRGEYEYADFLDERLPELTDVFEHDFQSQGFPMTRFAVINGRADENFLETPAGLRVTRDGKPGYRDTTYCPLLSASGDFDVTLAYDAYEPRSSTKGSISLILGAVLDVEPRLECQVMRRTFRQSDGGREELFQSVVITRTPEGVQRSYSPTRAFEAKSGALRLARRGEMLYLLVSEGDSPNFRLVRSERVGRDDVTINGIRVMAQVHNEGTFEVVWKSLHVRAESLSGLAVEKDPGLTAELDRSRKMLAADFVHDFAEAGLPDSLFRSWAMAPGPRQTEDGIRVRAEGFDDWRSTGATAHLAAEGDFDVGFDYDVLKMDNAAAGKVSGVYLQIEFPIESKLQCSALLVKHPEGGNQLVAQARLPKPDGEFDYATIQRLSVDRIRGVRLARRGERLYFLYRPDDQGPDRVFAYYDAGDAPLPDSSIRLLVHTGGAGKVTETVWKKLRVSAERITRAR